MGICAPWARPDNLTLTIPWGVYRSGEWRAVHRRRGRAAARRPGWRRVHPHRPGPGLPAAPGTARGHGRVAAHRGITAAAGTIAHWRTGRVRLAPGIAFGVLGVAGSYAGTRLSSSVPPDLLLSLFAGLMLAAAAAMLRRRPGRAGQDERAGGSTILRRALTIIAAATGVGLLTGFFGVGGGFVIVPALVLLLGFDMPAAVGTSLLVIAINSAAALAARLGGQVSLDWTLLAVFTAAALAGVLVGNRVASRVDPSRLSTAFTVLLIAVAGYSLARSLPGWCDRERLVEPTCPAWARTTSSTKSPASAGPRHLWPRRRSHARICAPPCPDAAQPGVAGCPRRSVG